MSRRRGDTLAVAVLLAGLVGVASLAWLHACAAAQPQLRRGADRARARLVARSAWERAAGYLARGELPPERLDPPLPGGSATLSARRLEGGEVQVEVRARVAAGADALGHLLRVRARVDGGRVRVVAWDEVGG